MDTFARACSLITAKSQCAGDALHKNVIRTQIAAFACSPPTLFPSSLRLLSRSPSSPSRSLQPRQIGNYFTKLRNQIAIKTPANIGFRLIFLLVIRADCITYYSHCAIDIRGKRRRRAFGEEVGEKMTSRFSHSDLDSHSDRAKNYHFSVNFTLHSRSFETEYSYHRLRLSLCRVTRCTLLRVYVLFWRC